MIAQANPVQIFAACTGISYEQAMKITDSRMIVAMRKLAELLDVELPADDFFRVLGHRDIVPKIRIDEGDLGQTVRMDYQFVSNPAPTCSVDFYNPPNGQPLLRIFFQNNMGEISCVVYQGDGGSNPEPLRCVRDTEHLPAIISLFLDKLQDQLYCPDKIADMISLSPEALFGDQTMIFEAPLPGGI